MRNMYGNIEGAEDKGCPNLSLTISLAHLYKMLRAFYKLTNIILSKYYSKHYLAHLHGLDQFIYLKTDVSNLKKLHRDLGLEICGYEFGSFRHY